MSLPDTTLPALFAATPEPPVDHAALVLARDAYPTVSVAHELRVFDTFAAPLARALGERPPLPHQATALRDHVYDHLGFAGDGEHYYDPRNSYLNEVVARRRGIPITLAVVLIAVGTRAGLDVQGVGFPGHFLVRLGGQGGLYLDPFNYARVLSRSDLLELARPVQGPGAREVAPEHLAPVSARALIVRMLNNLKGIYSTRRDHARALVVCDRLVDLAGGVEQRRDRGIHAVAMGAFGGATADLEAYLNERPGAADVAQVRALLERARAQRRASVQ
jgi:regulator of sirC expression with transglutaminase-like and TPR domain